MWPLTLCDYSCMLSKRVDKSHKIADNSNFLAFPYFFAINGAFKGCQHMPLLCVARNYTLSFSDGCSLRRIDSYAKIGIVLFCLVGWVETKRQPSPLPYRLIKMPVAPDVTIFMCSEWMGGFYGVFFLETLMWHRSLLHTNLLKGTAMETKIKMRCRHDLL